jgi:hypothetical protein
MLLQPGQPVAEASLRIEIDTIFDSAQASFWLDGKLIYSRSLKGEAGNREHHGRWIRNTFPAQLMAQTIGTGPSRATRSLYVN